MNGYVNNGEAGDLRRHRAPYDVTAMMLLGFERSQPFFISYLRIKITLQTKTREAL